MEQTIFNPLALVKKKTQRRQQIQGKTKIRINLSNVNVKKYYCPDLKPKSVLDKEDSTIITEANRNKFKKIPFISFKELLAEY